MEQTSDEQKYNAMPHYVVASLPKPLQNPGYYETNPSPKPAGDFPLPLWACWAIGWIIIGFVIIWQLYL